MTAPRELLRWTAWRPLPGAGRDPEIPQLPGLYRIRRVGRDDLDYIGQTGRSLRGRLGMLRGVYAEAMPYADPHTAAPALWALRHATGCDFDASVVPIEGLVQWRKGLEALTIALYRQERGASPTVEFGRVPARYLPSSGNNARLVAAGMRIRGGPGGDPHPRHEPGLAPLGPLEGDTQESGWGGHAWSDWIPLRDLAGGSTPRGVGLYRLRGDEGGTLLYVGEGAVPARPLAHLAKASLPDHAQGGIFADQARLECSWVLDEAWLPHQRLELENDLIAAHLFTTGQVPAAQFLG